MKSKYKAVTWTTRPDNYVDNVKRVLSGLSILVRTDQFSFLKSKVELTKKMKVLDVGLSPNELLPDTNIFERLYPHPSNLTAVSVEDCRNLKKKYPKVQILQVKPDTKLPFKNKEFDLVTAWATLEHVGDYRKQEKFINELLRVGKKVFLTTPYRGCPYEPHTGTFFLHYLPLNIFRKYLTLTGRSFMSSVDNLNPLFISNIKSFKLRSKVKVVIYKTFNLVPSHLMIYN